MLDLPRSSSSEGFLFSGLHVSRRYIPPQKYVWLPSLPLAAPVPPFDGGGEKGLITIILGPLPGRTKVDSSYFLVVSLSLELPAHEVEIVPQVLASMNV